MTEETQNSKLKIQNKRLVGTEEAARTFGVTPRAIQKWFAVGKIEGKFIKHQRAGKGGLKLKVWIDDTQSAEGIRDNERPLDSCIRRNDEKTQNEILRSAQNDIKEKAQDQDDKKRYKVYRGEPGCRVVTQFKNGIPIIEEKKDWIPAGVYPVHRDRAGMTDQGMQEGVSCDTIAVLNNGAQVTPVHIKPNPAEGGDLRALHHHGTGRAAGLMAVETKLESPPLQNLPAIIESKSLKPTNPKLERIAYLRFAILQKLKEDLAKEYPITLPLFKNGNGKPSKTKIIQKFLDLYNSGILLPTIYNDIKSISRATLYSWDRAEKFGGIRALIPQYTGPLGSKITEYEKYILLNILLHQNRLKIGSAIKFTKSFLACKKIKSPSSEGTLRRFIDQFKRTRYDAWIEAREGAKALNDKCLPYAERNWRLLTVGEGLVADGHRLNFRVINPFTGKPCRAMIVLFWDWKSAYPLGWEIMLEESIQCIASALRNAILCLGKIPKWLLIDNGKAFKAKVFTSDIDLEDGITYGMFATLGIHTHFSQAYNPQEKPLERFWGTFNNWFERLVPSYTGASIPDKPPYMLRNEKDAQARHNNWVPKIEEVQKMLVEWREFYANQPSRGRDGMKPKDIFEAEKGSGVDSTEFEFLMMAKEIKTVHRNGITWNGWHYFNEAMYGYKDKVVVRFTHADYSQLLIYMPRRNSYCIAKPVESVHPMASESEFPKNQEAVKQVSSLKSRVRRSTKNLLGLIQSGSMKQINWEHDMRRSPDVAKVVEALEKKDKIVPISPFAGAPEPEMPIEEKYPYPFYPDTEWARYEFHLKGGVYKGPELDKQYIDDFRTGKIAPGLWESLYAEKERLESQETQRNPDQQ